MCVLFYCPSHQGHHFPYLARMLPAFVELPVELCLATTARALESEEYERNLAKFSHRLTPYAVCMPPPRGTLKITRHRLRELSDVIRELKPDHVDVCYADGLWELALVQTMLGRRARDDRVLVKKTASDRQYVRRRRSR